MKLMAHMMMMMILVMVNDDIYDAHPKNDADTKNDVELMIPRRLLIILMKKMLILLMIMMLDEDSDFLGAENGTGLSWEHGLILLILLLSIGSTSITISTGSASQYNNDDSDVSGAENGAGLSWEHGQLHPGLFSHHEYDYG